MTDEDNKIVNLVYASGQVSKYSKRSKDGRSKYASQTTWGPTRRKKKHDGKPKSQK